MATQKQIDANRRNAQRSTGPRTPEGKAACRLNALKSGIDAESQIVPGEDPARLAALLTEYQERFETSTPERRMLVDTLVTCEWLLRRLTRAEASFWQYEAERTESLIYSNKQVDGRVLYHGDRVFERLQRRINSIQRNYHRALKELQSLEAADAAQPDAIAAGPGEVKPAPLADPPPAPAPLVMTPAEPPLNQSPMSRIGFVPAPPSGADLLVFPALSHPLEPRPPEVITDRL